MSIPRFWRRLYALAAIAYIALGFVFVGVAYAQMERIGPSFTATPVIQVPTGSDDVTVQKYYDYLQLRHLQQQTLTYGVNTVDLVIIYGVLGATLLIFAAITWAWFTRQKRGTPGLYPVEVYNGYITERGSPVDAIAWSNYAVMLAFMVFYIWWNLTFGQWY
jgi:hypothetical protein